MAFDPKKIMGTNKIVVELQVIKLQLQGLLAIVDNLEKSVSGQPKTKKKNGPPGALVQEVLNNRNRTIARARAKNNNTDGNKSA